MRELARLFFRKNEIKFKLRPEYTMIYCVVCAPRIHITEWGKMKGDKKNQLGYFHFSDNKFIPSDQIEGYSIQFESLQDFLKYVVHIIDIY